VRILFLCAAAACVALVAIGCGGGSKTKVAGGAKVCETGNFPLPPSYEPSGDIVADNGFRPDTNGFGVENYGNCGQQNLTPAAMSGRFGDQTVRLNGSGPGCQLDPAA